MLSCPFILALLHFRTLSDLYTSSLTKRKMQFNLPFASSSATAAWPLCPFSPVTHQFPIFQHGSISPFSFHTQFFLNTAFVFSSTFCILTCTHRGSTMPPGCSKKKLNVHFFPTVSQPLPEWAGKSWDINEQWHTTPDSSKPTQIALTVSNFSSLFQHVKILSLHTWET